MFREIAGDASGNAVIVKPNLGSRSRQVRQHHDLAALRHAFDKAKQLTPYPVVEEELRGFVFRITLVGGAIAGVMRREPPHVIGDGLRIPFRRSSRVRIKILCVAVRSSIAIRN